MEKVAILSCSTGQGHDSCARAIKEYFELQNISCEIRDSFDFISVKLTSFISWGHSCMYRTFPGLFRWGYGYAKSHPSLFREGSAVYDLLVSGAGQLAQFIAWGRFDTVVCAHVFSAIMLTHMLKIHPTPIRTAFVATDYTCHPGMGATDLHQYFIPHSKLLDEFSQGGIPKERIIPTGIPVRRSFFIQIGRQDAKTLLNIRAENKHLVMMCGSMGCGTMDKMVEIVSAILPLHTEMTVICGTNKYLYSRLLQKHLGDPKIHIIGYTDKISLYMDSADLYLTKPGGISITEAATKRLPMAFIKAVAGCEQNNMDYFIGEGAAVAADSPKELAKECIRILHSSETLQSIRQNLREYQRMDGAKNIFQSLNGGKLPCEK